MNNEQILFDYIENIQGIKVDTVFHIEDFIESVPNSDPSYDTIYQLYSVNLPSKSKPDLYAIITSKTANMVIKATNDILEKYFPDHIQDS